MTGFRIAYWLVVIGLGLWSVCHSSRPTAPTATRPLDVNHKLVPGDLETPEIAALTDRYLRTPVAPGEPVTGNMVGDKAGIPLIDSGVLAVVDVARAACDRPGIRERAMVRLRSGGQPLGDPGTVRSIVRDESRCAIAIGFDKAPGFDPKALAGAEVEAYVPPVPPQGQ